MDRGELVDLLLGELEPARARELAARLESDAELRAAYDGLAAAAALARAAASRGWDGAQAPLRWRRPAVAAAAAVLLALTAGLLLRGGSAPREDAVFEPPGAIGWLLPEETDGSGRGRAIPERADARLRAGRLSVSAWGATRAWPVGVGEALAFESELSTGAADGAQVDLPQGGALFVAPLSTVVLRQRDDGAVALRLTAGSMAVAATERPVHLAVEDTGLLLRLRSGAALLDHSPSEATCLRGLLVQSAGPGEEFVVPAGHRLPAACVEEPQTVRVDLEALDLDWYRRLAYASWETGAGPAEDAWVYAECRAEQATTVRISFGAAARTFPLGRDRTLRVRLRLLDLGPGPRVDVEPRDVVERLIVFRAVPR